MTSSQSPAQESINQLLALYNQGQLEAEIEQARIILATHSDNAVIWNLAGTANFSLSKIVEASDAFRKATELNPSFAGGHNNLAATFLIQEG